MKNVASNFMKPVKNFKLKSLLQNKFVLYVLVLVALLNILMLANSKDFNSVIVFVIVGFLTSFFSKNMIVILLTALLFTHALKYINRMVRKEGMEDKKKKEGMKNKKNKKEGMENEDGEEEAPATEDTKEEKQEVKIDSKEEELIKKKQTYDELKNDFSEFQSIQKDILQNMKEIDPLLEKAETFISKFEQYKKK